MVRIMLLLDCSARCDVRWGAAVFVGSDKTTIDETTLFSTGFVGSSCRSGGVNIASAERACWPPTSSHSSPLGLVLASLAQFDRSFGTKRRVSSLLLSTAARDPVLGRYP
jgi:hypothetical protein